MGVSGLLKTAQFLVDTAGNKKAVVLDYTIWEDVLARLEDLEDVEEIRRLRTVGEEAISWKQAKAELRSEGIDV